MGHSESDLRKLCPGAKIERGLAIRGCEAANSEKKAADWARSAV